MHRENVEKKGKRFAAFEIVIGFTCFILFFLLGVRNRIASRTTEGYILIIYAEIIADMLAFGALGSDAYASWKYRKMIAELNNVDSKPYKNIFHGSCRIIIRHAVFTLLGTFIMSVAFWIMYYLQGVEVTGIWKDFILAGIQVPVLFILAGFILRLVQHVCRIEEVKDSVALIAVTLDICMFFVDWTCALFIGVVIAGKKIWLDSAFDYKGIKELLEHLEKWIEKIHTDSGVLAVTRLYCDAFLTAFILVQTFYFLFSLIGGRQ